MERDEDHVTALVLNLKPWTQYAVYVQTYTTSSAKYGAISNIVYFTTLPYCTSTHTSPLTKIREGRGFLWCTHAIWFIDVWATNVQLYWILSKVWDRFMYGKFLNGGCVSVCRPNYSWQTTSEGPGSRDPQNHVESAHQSPWQCDTLWVVLEEAPTSAWKIQRKGLLFRTYVICTDDSERKLK